MHIVATTLSAGVSMREEDRIFENVLAQGAQSILKKNSYKLRYIGGGGSAFGGPITFFAISFMVDGPLSKEQLRKILIEGAKDFLEVINTDKKAQKLLFKRPFTLEDIEIVIFNHDKDGRDLSAPMISIAEISRGELLFSARSNAKPFLLSDEYKESYQEALEILNKEKRSLQNPN